MVLSFGWKGRQVKNYFLSISSLFPSFLFFLLFLKFFFITLFYFFPSKTKQDFSSRFHLFSVQNQLKKESYFPLSYSFWCTFSSFLFLIHFSNLRKMHNRKVIPVIRRNYLVLLKYCSIPLNNDTSTDVGYNSNKKIIKSII